MRDTSQGFQLAGVEVRKPPEGGEVVLWGSRGWRGEGDAVEFC